MGIENSLPEGIRILAEITVIRGKSEVPGFEAIFAIAGLLMIAYVLRRSWK